MTQFKMKVHVRNIY